MTNDLRPDREPPDMDPFTNSLDIFGGHGMRRLVRFHILCPLCGEEHRPEYYFTLPTEDPEQFGRAVGRFMEASPGIQMAIRICAQIHNDDDDLQALMRTLPGRQVSFGIVGHDVLKESDYVCDFCSATFPTIADLRIHLGSDPDRVPDYDRALAPYQQ